MTVRAFRFTAWGAAAVVAGATVAAGRPVPAGIVLFLWLAAAAIKPAVVLRRLTVVYYAGLLALMTAAVVANPLTVFAAWVVFVHCFGLFAARWAFAWSVLAAVVLTTAQAGVTGETVTVMVSLLPPLVVAGIHLVRETRKLQSALAENRALQRRLVEQARDAERQRVAQDLHDTLTQDLSAAAVLLDGATDERAARARELVRAGLGEARRSVRALTPAPLDGVPLPDALDRLVRQWAADTGIDATFDGDPVPPMRPAVAAAVYRIGQSALANVAQHAGATRVRLTLSSLDDSVVLDVRDDGGGFDPDAGPVDDGRGFGLPGMRERVTALGGTLDVETARGQGTAVRAAIPVAA